MLVIFKSLSANIQQCLPKQKPFDVYRHRMRYNFVFKQKQEKFVGKKIVLKMFKHKQLNEH